MQQKVLVQTPLNRRVNVKRKKQEKEKENALSTESEDLVGYHDEIQSFEKIQGIIQNSDTRFFIEEV